VGGVRGPARANTSGDRLPRVNATSVLSDGTIRRLVDDGRIVTNLTEEVVIEPGDPFAIHPGEFALGRTLERVELPDDVVARIEGKSSLGRLGLIVHATAGFVDPGFRGTLTLEITNLTRVPIKLYAGLLIAQLSFMTLDAPAERPYGSEALGSHYQGQVAATESRYMR
jgi:dCTP deaminase